MFVFMCAFIHALNHLYESMYTVSFKRNREGKVPDPSTGITFR